MLAVLLLLGILFPPALVKADQSDVRYFEIEQVSAHVYAAIARPTAILNGNVGIVALDDGLLVVDAGISPVVSRSLIQQIREEIGRQPIRYLVLTHGHLDHAFGLQPFVDEGAVVIGTKAARDELGSAGQAMRGYAGFIRSEADKISERGAEATSEERETMTTIRGFLDAAGEDHVAVPPMVIADELRIEGRGSVTIAVRFLGRGHTAGDLTVEVVEDRVLFTGDLLHGYDALLDGGYPDEWIETLGAIDALPWNHVVPGHGSVQHDRATLKLFQAHLVELVQRVRAGVADGRTLEDLKQEIRFETLDVLGAGGLGARIEDEWRRTLHPLYRPGLPKVVDNQLSAVYAILVRGTGASR